MASANLSHDEVWDDSALVTSWNDALAEYKKYHSLAAKGEKVPAVPDNAQNGTDDSQEYGIPTEEQIGAQELPQANGTKQSTKPTPKKATSIPKPGPGPAAMPIALLNGMQDEGLKSLMMSWYYAGYYTGLYEGQQKAYVEMQGE